jgi:transmembrane sensor
MVEPPASRSDVDPLAQDLAACFACLHDPAADPAVQANWRGWLAADPERVRRYRDLERFWSVLPAAETRRRSRLARFAYADVPTRQPWAALAAVLTVVGLLGWWGHVGWFPSEPVSYAAAQGVQRHLVLDDGSSVLLDSDSSLTVRFERRQRTVELDRGQALFEVAHDPSRPFVVRAKGGEIRAVGTEFDVHVTEAGVDVTLLQGAVLVAPPAGGEPGGRREAHRVARLAPGQQVSYRDELGGIRTVDPGIATAWREGRPSYLDRPLGDVVTDLRRYLAHPIRISDPNVASIRYTGTVSVRNLESWLRALEQVYPVRAAFESDGTVVLSPKR